MPLGFVLKLMLVQNGKEILTMENIQTLENEGSSTKCLKS